MKNRRIKGTCENCIHLLAFKTNAEDWTSYCTAGGQLLRLDCFDYAGYFEMMECSMEDDGRGYESEFMAHNDRRN